MVGIDSFFAATVIMGAIIAYFIGIQDDAYFRLFSLCEAGTLMRQKPKKKQIGFHVREKSEIYRTKSRKETKNA